MSERSQMIAWIRGEIVGPSQALAEPTIADFVNREFVDVVPLRRGPLAWRPHPDASPQEVLYFERESPHRKYGVGLLHPTALPATNPTPDQVASQANDPLGAEPEAEESSSEVPSEGSAERNDDTDDRNASETGAGPDASDDFEVTSTDVRRPSTIGISFCVELNVNGQVIVQLPLTKLFLGKLPGRLHFQRTAVINRVHGAGRTRMAEQEKPPCGADFQPCSQRLP